MKKLSFQLCLLLGLTLLFSSACDDDTGNSPINPVPKEVQNINGFVYQNMRAYYFWEHLIPELDYRREENTFDLFEKCTYRKVDRWSFITDDYQGLKEMLSGVSKSAGYGVRLYYRDHNHSNEVIGFIEYVEPGSPGDIAGLKRGDVIWQIDNTVLDDENYLDLLYRDTYTLTLGTLYADRSISAQLPALNIKTVQLQSNPILEAKVISYEGFKVGYLAYTSFLDEYNKDLEAVFADFKANNVDHLVVDLRYNSGGDVSSAILLSNMIAPANKEGEVLLRTSYNPALSEYLELELGSEFNLDYLAAHTSNLNLERLYVLTTYKTASASEMLIYGLAPHMEVVQIGEKTHGKYYGSITISDPEEKHNWAMQPIVLRAENKDNSIDYNDGLPADIEKQDFDIAFDEHTIYPLGDPREDFLATALQHIVGAIPQAVSAKDMHAQPNVPLNTEAQLVHPLRYDMQYDLPLR
ncbi:MULTISPECIES: S41 family peptidase [unclassified Carboxylicivirga]|uniref:S41 family peptidase n=1 Tax=Carboxylicivirga TaxID=1628153 RepID=UPI003D33449A